MSGEPSRGGEFLGVLREGWELAREIGVKGTPGKGKNTRQQEIVCLIGRTEV